MSTTDKTGEIVSFEKAGHAHVHARKEEKFNRIKKAFKALTDEKFGVSAKGKTKSKRKKSKGSKNK